MPGVMGFAKVLEEVMPPPGRGTIPYAKKSGWFRSVAFTEQQLTLDDEVLARPKLLLGFLFLASTSRALAATLYGLSVGRRHGRGTFKKEALVSVQRLQTF